MSSDDDDEEYAHKRRQYPTARAEQEHIRAEYIKTLREFKEENGHLKIGTGEASLRKVSVWLSKQRRKMKEGCLDENTMKELNDLGVDWEPARGRRKRE